MAKPIQQEDFYELTSAGQKKYIKRVLRLMKTIDLKVDKPDPIEYALAIEGIGEMCNKQKKLFILCERGQITFDELMIVTMELDLRNQQLEHS